jgi:hypothetical protein
MNAGAPEKVHGEVDHLCCVGVRIVSGAEARMGMIVVVVGIERVCGLDSCGCIYIYIYCN